MTMWRNYWTVAVRALAKNRTYAFINIFGLAIGLAACLMLLLYVRYETTYDQWLPDAANTYQFQTHYQHPQTGQPPLLQMTRLCRPGAAQEGFPAGRAHGLPLQDNGPVFLQDGQA